MADSEGLEPAIARDGTAFAPEGPAAFEPSLGGLFQALADARPSSARLARIRALIELGQRADPRGLATLAEALHDADWATRKYATSALAGLGPGQPTALVLEALADDHVAVRRAAARALARLDDGHCLEAWLVAARDADWLVRAAALAGLKRYAGRPAVVEVYLAGLRDPAWVNRFHALEAVAGSPDRRAVPALLAVLARDGSLAVRAAELLAASGPPAWQAMIGLLDDAPAGRQLAIARALGGLDAPIARAALAGLLGHPDAEVEEAILAQGPAIVPDLLPRLAAEAWRVRWHACRLLGQLGDPAGALALRPLVQDGRLEVCLAAIEALGTLADPCGEADLLHALASPSWRVRAATARALGRLATPRAIAALVEATRDARGEVREAARAGLLTGGARALAAIEASLAGRPGDAELAWLQQALRARAAEGRG